MKSAEEYSLKTIQGGSGATISSQKHGLRSIQANTTDGTIDGKLFRSISLEGENYIYLVLDIYGYDCSVVSTQRVSNAFAKIILDQSPGNLCFNSFISSSLKELSFPMFSLVMVLDTEMKSKPF